MKLIKFLILVVILFLGLVLFAFFCFSRSKEQIKPPIFIEQVKEYVIIEMIVIAYCPCRLYCGRFSDKITASGHVVQLGDRFVATPSEVPFGTFVIVPGYNNNQPVPVLDRGGLIKENKIDVYFDMHEKALRWGKQYLKVKVLKEKL